MMLKRVERFIFEGDKGPALGKEGTVCLGVPSLFAPDSQ